VGIFDDFSVHFRMIIPSIFPLSQRPDDEERLVGQIIKLATRHGRYGYRRITALLKNDCWRVNHKRVERIWAAGGPEGASEATEAGPFVAQ
jgi:hypothetical protein